MNRLRSKLTYANVVATLALFIALGGASYAAVKLPKNSVGTRQIKNNAITGAKIKNGAISGSKIALSSLGAVPSATTAQAAVSAQTAANSQTLQGMTPVQIAALAKLTCPSGMRMVAGVCFETTSRASSEFFGAEKTCAKVGRRLPDQGELAAYDFVAQNSSNEWVANLGHVTTPTSEFVAFQTELTESSYGAGYGAIFSSPESAAYRCVTAPSN
jgi:hypothetical protein